MEMSQISITKKVTIYFDLASFFFMKQISISTRSHYGKFGNQKSLITPPCSTEASSFFRAILSHSFFVADLFVCGHSHSLNALYPFCTYLYNQQRSTLL